MVFLHTVDHWIANTWITGLEVLLEVLLEMVLAYLLPQMWTQLLDSLPMRRVGRVECCVSAARCVIPALHLDRDFHHSRPHCLWPERQILNEDHLHEFVCSLRLMTLT